MGCRVIVVEPQHVMAELMNYTFKLNGWDAETIMLHNNAISDTLGVELELPSQYTPGGGSGPIHTKTVSVPQVLQSRELRYLKLDIDGPECAILQQILDLVRGGTAIYNIMAELSVARWSGLCHKPSEHFVSILDKFYDEGYCAFLTFLYYIQQY